MFSQNQMPNFKMGDLVRSRVALAIARIVHGRYESATSNAKHFEWFSVQNIPVDCSLVKGLPINIGVVFEVDAVLPWDAPSESIKKRYRLVLNPRHFEYLSKPDLQRSEAEYLSLRIILAEDDLTIPFFYVYADEKEIELVVPTK